MAKTYNVGRLSVEMVADTVQYVQKLKDAENKTKQSQEEIRKHVKRTKGATEEGEKSNKKYSESLSKMGQAAALVSGPMGGVASRIGALNSLLGGAGGFLVGVGGVGFAAAAAAASVYNMGTALSDQYKTLKAYAGIAGVTTRQMQLLSHATRTVEIDQEKLGDVTKDIQDKLGDFVSTGAGPFKDVFAVLGDNIQYTGEQLQEMSGPKVLEVMTHAMQKANLPLAKQVFLMESIADDASKLLPLYANMSSEMNKLQYEADITTRSLDDQQKIYGTLSKSIDLLKQNTADFLTEAGAPFAEWVNGSVRELNILISSYDKTSEAARLLKMDEVAEELSEMETALENSTTKMGRFTNAMTLNSSDAVYLKKRIKELREEYQKLIDAGVEKMMPEKPKKEKPEDPFAGMSQDQLLSGLFDEIKIHERRRKENERFAKERQSARQREINEAKQHAKEMARLAKEKMKADIEADKAGFAEMENLRKQHYETLKAQAELQKKALLGPVFAQDGQTQAQAELQNQLSMLDLNLQTELEMLRQNYAGKYQLEQQYQAAVSAAKNKYYADTLSAHEESIKAEMALYTQLGGVIGNHIVALAGASDEEKKELTKQFLVQQAMAAGQVTIEYFAAMAAHESAAAAMGPAGAAYLALEGAKTTASWQKNLAGIAAVSVMGGLAGQFHDGGVVPAWGDNKSFLLKAGERVVAPEDNNKLSDFLNREQRGQTNSGNVQIDASMTIQGNVTDQKWFQQELIKHRQMIKIAVAKANQERPR